MAEAQFISCGSYSECERAYANQRARAIEGEMMRQQMRETGEQRARVRAAIAAAREQFWATYPDKPGAEKARKDFAYWLGTKDIYYLREHLKAPVMTDEHGRRTTTVGADFFDTFGGLDEKIDDGIRPSALHEFEDWAMAVRDKLFEGHTSHSTDDALMQGWLATWMGQKFWDAVAATTAQYDAYVALRDWWEFDHVNRVPAGFDTPATYGIYLYSRFRKVPLPDAMSNYKKMTELLGIDRVQAAAKRVMEAPKADDGALVVTVDPYKKGPGGGQMIDYDKPMPDGVIGVYADPARAMELLATLDDDRRYLLYLLHNHAPDLRRIDPATTWTFAETAYKRLVLAFGEPAVLQAAHAVRLAPKRMYSGGVITVKELGVKRTEPIETVQDLLAVKDARGYVKAALVFAKDLDSATAVDGAYKTYVETKGEPAVLAAAQRRALNKPQLTYKGELELLEGEITTPTVERPQAAQMDSPQYLAWKRFKPGANASYIDRILAQPQGQRDLINGAVNMRSRFLLRSIDDERANLYQTIIAYDNPSPRTPMISGAAHPPRDNEIAYPARVEATVSAQGQAAAGTPLQSGEETLEIRGQKIATRWESVQMGASRHNCGPTIITTWTSDEVPGGLVRKTIDAACASGRSVRETLLESFQAAGSVDSAQPIQPASEFAPILPLHVASTVEGQEVQSSVSTARPVMPPPGAPGRERRPYDPNMSTSTPRQTPPAASSATDGRVVPQGTQITVMVSGAINSTTNPAGANFRGTIVQPVIVNDAPLIPYGTQVTMKLAQGSDDLGIIMTGIILNGRTLAATSTPAGLDAQTASRNAAMEHAIASAGPRGDRMRSRLEAQQVLVNGSRVNVPSGTRLVFTLSDPIPVQ